MLRGAEILVISPMMKHQHRMCTRNFLCTRFWSVDFWDMNTISFFLVLSCRSIRSLVTFYWKSAALLHTRWRSLRFAVVWYEWPQARIASLQDFWQLLISSRWPKHEFCRSPNICKLSHHDCTSVLKQKDVAWEHGLLWWMLYFKQFKQILQGNIHFMGEFVFAIFK